MTNQARNLKLPSRYYFSDPVQDPDPLGTIEALPKNTGVVFRHYKTDDRSELAERVAAVCKRKNLLLLIAGDPNLAQRVKADGLHMPSWNLSPKKFKNPLGSFKIISASVHNEKEIRAAENLGAKLVFIGPLFPTASHPETLPLGEPGFLTLCGKTNLPVYAIGGVTEKNFKTLPPLENLKGFAGISNFRKKSRNSLGFPNRTSGSW